MRRSVGNEAKSFYHHNLRLWTHAHRMGPILAIALGVAPQAVAQSAVHYHTVLPQDTFLRTYRDQYTEPISGYHLEPMIPIPVDLAAIGVRAGDLLNLSVSGTVATGSFGRQQVLGVFSSAACSPQILGSNVLDRVPCAIDAHRYFVSTPTRVGRRPTDVPFDFLVNDGPILVPDGARYLYLCSHDNFYSDNQQNIYIVRASTGFGSALNLPINGIPPHVFANFDAALVTVEAWVNIDTFNTDHGEIAWYKGQNGTSWLLAAHDEGNLQVAPSFVVGANSVVSERTFARHTWHHLAGAFDGTTIRLYVDGILAGSKSGGSLAGAGANSQVQLGGKMAVALDEVRVWTIARSEESIRCSMNRPIAANAAGLFAYWPMEKLIQDNPSPLPGHLRSASDFPGFLTGCEEVVRGLNLSFRGPTEVVSGAFFLPSFSVYVSDPSSGYAPITPPGAPVCGEAVFSVNASGPGPVAYRWQFERPAIPGLWLPVADFDNLGPEGGPPLFSVPVGTGVGPQTATLRVWPRRLEANGIQFRVIASNGCAYATSAPAIMSASDQSVHVEPLADASVPVTPPGSPVCGEAVFEAHTTGSGALSYQWQMALPFAPTVWHDLSEFDNFPNSAGIPLVSIPVGDGVGPHAANLRVWPRRADADGALLRVLVTGGCGLTASETGVLSVIPGVRIVGDPVDQRAPVTPPNSPVCGQAVFEVAAEGGGSIFYHWQYSLSGNPNSWRNVNDFDNESDSQGIPLFSVPTGPDIGTHSSTLVVWPRRVNASGLRFRAVVTGGCETITSQVATLGISESILEMNDPQSQVAPVTQPSSQAVGFAHFSGSARSNQAARYQWQFARADDPGTWRNVGDYDNDIGPDGIPLFSVPAGDGIGSTTTELWVMPRQQAANGARFRVTATTDCGVTISQPATLQIGTADVSMSQLLPQSSPLTPPDVSVCGEARYEISVTGGGALSYRWQYAKAATPGDWTDVIAFDNGADNADMTLFSVPVDAVNSPSSSSIRIWPRSPETDGMLFRVAVSNGVSDWFSNSAPLLLTCTCRNCAADFNFDGGVDGTDVYAFFEAWEMGTCDADVNTDGGVDGADVASFFAEWEAGVC